MSVSLLRLFTRPQRAALHAEAEKLAVDVEELALSVAREARTREVQVELHRRLRPEELRAMVERADGDDELLRRFIDEWLEEMLR